MFKRRVYKELLDWKSTEGHGALLVTGARQIGKTFLVKEFAEREYSAHVTWRTPPRVRVTPRQRVPTRS